MFVPLCGWGFALWCIAFNFGVHTVLDLWHLLVSGSWCSAALGSWPQPSGPHLCMKTVKWHCAVGHSALLTFIFLHKSLQKLLKHAVRPFWKAWSCDSTAGGKHNTEDWKRTLLLPSPIRGLLTQASLLLSSHLGSTDVQNILRTLPRWQLRSTFYLAKHMEMETLDSVGRKCHCATSTTPFQRRGIKRKSVPAESLLWLFVSYASHVTVILAPIKSNMIFY